MKTALWLSYDLGVKGDYQGLYEWLDALGASECGDSFAFIPVYSYEGDLIPALKRDLEKAIQTDRRTRVYVVHYDGTKQKKGPKGTFVLGRRRGAPWAGHAPGSGTDTDEA